MKKSHFNTAFFKFLRDIKKNNNRPWFLENKERYEKVVRNPLLDFIGEVGRSLRQINKHIIADNSPSGGSMFRIYRDARFSKDKSPYKTHASARFPIARGKDVHSPGYYLHLEPGGVFCGGGIWRPEPPVLGQIRDFIANHPRLWKQLVADRNFKKFCSLEGEKLQRPPKGYDPGHELIEVLKYKDYIYFTEFTEKQACSPGFMDKFVESCAAGAPLIELLATALKFEW